MGEKDLSEAFLDQPDYVGNWQGNRSGHFDLYILARTPAPIPESIPSRWVQELRDLEQVEGVIVDQVGLAIFSGEFGRRSVNFIKTYSAAARHKGGVHNISYEGILDENTGSFRGRYSIIGTLLSGEFDMTKTDQA